jgi:multidrug efflux pump subunit AcrB
MAWVIIGGLISSTLLARLVTPVMYKLIPPQV